MRHFVRGEGLMQSIVCQVESQPDRVSFTWSQGKDSSGPSHPAGDVAGDSGGLAKGLRGKLAAGAAESPDAARQPGGPAAEFGLACYSLARAGHELFGAVFDPGEANRAQAATA